MSYIFFHILFLDIFLIDCWTWHRFCSWESCVQRSCCSTCSSYCSDSWYTDKVSVILVLLCSSGKVKVYVMHMHPRWVWRLYRPYICGSKLWEFVRIFVVCYLSCINMSYCTRFIWAMKYTFHMSLFCWFSEISF